MNQLGDLRVRLDQMAERIVSRLKDRSRFPLNEAVYLADGVPIRDRPGISFLEFAIEGLEAYHASLGRYDYPDQHRLSKPPREDAASSVRSPVARSVSVPALAEAGISIGDELLAFYRQLLRRLCPAGDDPNSYGETVYVDADLLQLINERVNVGRYVAHAKLKEDGGVAQILHDAGQLAARLRDSAREEAVIASARQMAARCALDQDIAAGLFRWIMDETLAVEVAYLQATGK